MDRFIICVAILFAVVCCNLSYVFSTDSIIQSTTGDQSPAIHAGGDVFLSYFSGLSYKQVLQLSQSICESLQNARSAKEEDANKEADKLRAILARVFAATGASPEGIQERVQHFLDTLQVRKEKIRLQEDDYQKSRDQALVDSKKLEVNLEFLFRHIFDYIDPFTSAMKESGQLSSIEISDYKLLYDASSPHNDRQGVRRIVFLNGSSIEITLFPGKIIDGLIQRCPDLVLSGRSREVVHSTFRVEPSMPGGFRIGRFDSIEPPKRQRIPDVHYSHKEKELLTKSFKDSFKRSFDDLFGRTFVEDTKGSDGS
jgi:hypothetical protein